MSKYKAFVFWHSHSMGTRRTQYDYMDGICRANQDSRADLGMCNSPEGNSGEEPVRRYLQDVGKGREQEQKLYNA